MCARSGALYLSLWGRVGDEGGVCCPDPPPRGARQAGEPKGLRAHLPRMRLCSGMSCEALSPTQRQLCGIPSGAHGRSMLSEDVASSQQTVVCAVNTWHSRGRVARSFCRPTACARMGTAREVCGRLAKTAWSLAAPAMQGVCIAALTMRDPHRHPPTAARTARPTRWCATPPLSRNASTHTTTGSLGTGWRLGRAATTNGRARGARKCVRKARVCACAHTHNE